MVGRRYGHGVGERVTSAWLVAVVGPLRDDNKSPRGELNGGKSFGIFVKESCKRVKVYHLQLTN